MLNNSQNVDSVIALAGQMSEAFEGRERDNGDKFRKLRDGSPEWMSDVALAAHSFMGRADDAIMPNDWIYDKAENAVDFISGMDGIPSEFEDAAHEFADSNVDLYNGELAHWLSLNVWFGEYVDEATREFGPTDEGIYRQIQAGQYHFLREMFAAIVEALESVAEDMPEDDAA